MAPRKVILQARPSLKIFLVLFRDHFSERDRPARHPPLLRLPPPQPPQLSLLLGAPCQGGADLSDPQDSQDFQTLETHYWTEDSWHHTQEQSQVTALENHDFNDIFQFFISIFADWYSLFISDYLFSADRYRNRNYKSAYKSVRIRGGICHSRHSRRECKFFASGVNFSRNNAVCYINESKKLHFILISSLKLLTYY